MRAPTVLLFDIDGTLMDTGGAGRRSMNRAFERAHGRHDACDSIAFGGMTDRAIARAGLLAIGVEPVIAAVDALIAAYLAALADEIVASRSRVLPGVLATLAAVATSGAAVGLGTGNVRDGARLKLGKVGLHERFAFGGFGDDHETRSELLRVGAARGAAALGRPVDACRVVVIGDTPKDVAAAQAIGAECVAVATGPFKLADLAETSPSRLFADLDQPGAIEAILGR
jgi:phosphoglycolate phosphatase-like HAD superfamily hydrolase